MAEVGSLRVEIEALTARFDQAMDRADRKLDRLGKTSGRTEREVNRFGRGIDRLGATLRRATRLAGLFGASLSIAGISALTRSTVSFADEIGKAADRVGLSTSALQEYRVAAELTGVAQRSLDTSMQRFSRRVGEAAAGSGVLAKVLNEQNIALRDNQGNLRSNESILDDYADAIARADSEQERLRLAFVAFDREGAALVNTFRDGSAGLDALRQAARDAGLVIEEHLIRRAEDVNDRWTLLARRFQTVIGVRILEAFEFAFTEGAQFATFAFTRIAQGVAILQRVFAVTFDGIVAIVKTAFELQLVPVRLFFDTIADGLARLAALGQINLFGTSLEFGNLRPVIDALDEIVLRIPRVGDAFAAVVAGDSALQSELETLEQFGQARILQLEDEARKLDELTRRRRESLGSIGAGSFEDNDGGAAASKAAAAAAEASRRREDAAQKALQAQADSFKAQTRSLEEQLLDQLASLERLRVAASQGLIEFDVTAGGTLERAIDAAFQKYEDAIDRMNTATKSFISEWELAEGELDAIAARAGASIQQNFADFLFDPFEEGLSGLLRAFTATLRRMIAEVAAARLFDAIAGTGFGSALREFFGGAIGGTTSGAQGPPRMFGGAVTAGVPYPVGERGPELFVPSSSGRVIPNTTTTPIVNINVENRGTAQDVESVRTEFDGERMMINVITRDVARRGPIAATFEGAYGLQRGR